MLTSEEAVYQRVIELLLQQHQLAWSTGARPTPAGLLDCLTQDASWEVLAAHRQGEPASKRASAWPAVGAAAGVAARAALAVHGWMTLAFLPPPHPACSPCWGFAVWRRAPEGHPSIRPDAVPGNRLLLCAPCNWIGRMLITRSTESAALPSC